MQMTTEKSMIPVASKFVVSWAECCSPSVSKVETLEKYQDVNTMVQVTQDVYDAFMMRL